MGVFIETVLLVILLVISHLGIYLWITKKKPKSIKDRHVVVTGGSSGIGLWIAIHSVKLGANVTIIARNITNLEAALKQIKSYKVNEQQKIQYRSLDLATSYDAVEKCLDELEQTIGSIFMLVNCAGMAICGTVDEMSIDDAKRMMDINYYATFYPTRYVLKKLKKIGDGIITITGSQSSLLGIYGYGAYTAAKFALRGLAETIAMEVANTQISITLALPADTDTPGFANENLSKPEVTKIISGGGGLAKPELIAQKILNDSLTGNFISIYGIVSWVVTLICSGMSPWGGIGLTLLQVILLGPLRLVAFGLQYRCHSIVKSCAKKQKQTTTTTTDKKDK